MTAGSPAANDFDRAGQASTLYRMGDWFTGWIELGFETKTRQLLIELLEPPEFPENGEN